MNPEKIRIVFMGTPDFAVAPLRALNNAGFNIAGVVTAPDRPAGRGKKIKSSAVKEFVQSNLNCPVFQPEKLKDPDFITRLNSLQAHLFVVVAFRMLPEVVWTIPEKGTINLHASLLPQYRGAAPINWAIINGETETGVSTFLIDQKIDTGKILLQENVNIEADENAGTLHDKLMETGSALIVKTVSQLVSGNINPIGQQSLNIPEEELKKAPKIFREDCKIKWSENSAKVHNLIRGLSPFPGAYTIYKPGKSEELQLKIYKTTVLDETTDHKPGTIITDNKTYMHVATKDHILDIKELQLQGKKRMSAADFIRGYLADLNGIRFL